jgi:hypothetical protein
MHTRLIVNDLLKDFVQEADLLTLTGGWMNRNKKLRDKVTTFHFIETRLQPSCKLKWGSRSLLAGHPRYTASNGITTEGYFGQSIPVAFKYTE